MIVDDLSPLATPIEKLHELEGNPRVGDVEALARSLDAFGQRKPVVAKRSGEIIAGNHTYKAARSLGWNTLAVVFVDDDDTTAKAFALADNRTAELGTYDDELLATLLEDVANTDLFGATGWDEASLQELLDKIERDAASVLAADDEELASFAVYEEQAIFDEAFAHYRERGFPYRKLSRLDCMQQLNSLAATPFANLMNTTTAYHVADTYHPHRLAGHAEGMKSPIESFESDQQLMRAFKLCVEHYGGNITDSTLHNALSLVAGTQACSNFRPGFALRMYREFTSPGDAVLDTSTGYGGRLVGFLASKARTYVGIDPSRATHEANTRLANDLARGQRVTLFNEPAEDVDADKLAASCDFAFTSPPYFTKEHYAEEETQSFKRYPQPEAWRTQFLEPMMRLQYAALRDGAHACVNIADVKLRNTWYPLEDWTQEAGKAAGFELIEVRRFPMPRAFAANDSRESYEPVFVFRK